MVFGGLVKFLGFAGMLKRVRRAGWVEAGVVGVESVADHSYRTALLAMVLADLEGLDSGRVLKLAVLHDLGESITGDLTPEQKPGDHASVENRAMEEILSTLPERLGKEYFKLWIEYQSRATPEARLVYSADKLEMIMQALEYQEQGTPSDKLDHFWDAEILEEYMDFVVELKKLRG